MTETLGHREAFDFHYRLGEGRSHKLGYSSPYRILSTSSLVIRCWRRS